MSENLQMAILVGLLIGAVLLLCIVRTAGTEDDRNRPKYRGVKRMGGNIVTDMRSDAEFEQDANRGYGDTNRPFQ
jgi:hypothetical protein